MLRSGRWPLVVASVGLLLVAAAHTLGHLQPPPQDGPQAELIAAMDALRLDGLGLGWRPSVHEVFDSLSLTMTIALIWLGALGLVVAKLDRAACLLRPFALLAAAGNGALVVLFWQQRIAPPFVTLAVVELFFVLAAWRPGRAMA